MSKMLSNLVGMAALLLTQSANAADLQRVYKDAPGIAIAEGVAVPPGFTTYYISGALPKALAGASPSAPEYGDTATQTRSVLDGLKITLAKMGIGFGDVVAAHVFLDPRADFAAMNKVWSEEFGTPAQPNKPARAAFRTEALVQPGALLEIEFVAAKK